jgi:hypothetical protein
MIKKQTIIDRIEITRTGHIQIRFELLIVENGTEIASTWHRTSIEPGGNVDFQLAAVNAHLQAMGKLPIENAEIPRLKAIASFVHDPATVAAHLERMKANELQPPSPPTLLSRIKDFFTPTA